MEHAAKIANIATTDHSVRAVQSSMRKTFSGFIFSYQNHDMFQTAAENTSESS